jgi:hypothetical protein
VTAALLPYWALPDLPNDDDPAAWKNYHIEMRRALDRLRRDARSINQALNIPAFSAHRNGAAQSIETITSTKILWTHTALDTHDSFDTTNARYQTRVAGWFHFFAQVWWNNHAPTGGEQRMTTIFKNDGAVEDGRFARVELAAATSGAPTVACNSLMYLVSGDYVNVYAYQDSGSARGVLGEPGGTYFHGYKIAD